MYFSNGNFVKSYHCADGGAYDMYDFSGVSNDLAILRSQLFTLNVGEKPKPNYHATDNNSQ